jgi:hypothetical protein
METLMFEVPHYHFSISEWKDIKDVVLSKLKVKEPQKIPPNPEYSLTTSYWDTFDYTDYSEFLSTIEPYLSSIPNVSQVTRVWFQTAKQYEYHTAHTHGTIGWSAVFYADFDPEFHIPTKFYSPFTNITGNVDVFCPRITEGDLIVFPASVLHEAPINTSTTPRTIISFNIL